MIQPALNITSKIMAFNIDFELKKICVRRCFTALIYSVSAQYALLFLFLLFINFSPLHPISWLTTSLYSICSWYTWLCIIPLISLVIVYGIVLGKLYIAKHEYFASRFALLFRKAVPLAIFLLLHILIGFMTAWLYAKFIHTDYNHFYSKCLDESNCINAAYTFIILNGIYTGIYYFVRERVRKDTTLQFPIIQQSQYLNIRANVFQIVYKSLQQSCLPTVAYLIGTYLLGGVFLSNVAQIFALHFTREYTLFDFYLIVYIYLVSAQILSNMRIMEFLFTTLLTEYTEFSISQTTTAQGERNDVIMVEALSASRIPIVQQLAALDLYTLATKDFVRRQQIYTLSIPGGHPYTWISISSQCLGMINSYREELNKSIEHIISNNNQTFRAKQFPLKPTASDMAQQLLFRQYNENYGIRNLAVYNNENTMSTGSQETNVVDPCKRFNETTQLLALKFNKFKEGLIRAPGIGYLFAEPESAKVSFLLKTESETISWIVQGLSALAASSLKEDRFGVVQSELSTIIKSLIQLKQVLDKVSLVNFVDTECHYQCMSIKNAVKRSLYSITTEFADYLPDLVKDSNDMRIIENFAQYRET